MKKYEFDTKSINFSRFIIKADGIVINPKKYVTVHSNIAV